jgi:hypothetical protein
VRTYNFPEFFFAGKFAVYGYRVFKSLRRYCGAPPTEPAGNLHVLLPQSRRQLPPA